MQSQHYKHVVLACISQPLPRLKWRRVCTAMRILLGCALVVFCCQADAGQKAMTEHQLKAAYLLNFIGFTTWPAELGDTLTLCIYGPDPFGADIDNFQGENVNGHSLDLLRISTADQLAGCNVVFISGDVISNLRRVLDYTDAKPVLTIADSPGAAANGVNLNMNMEQNKITFEVNLATANSNGLSISFQLLRLAKRVYK